MKKKIIIIGLTIIFIAIICVISIYLYFYHRNLRICLINESVEIEYGENYNPTIEDLIDLTEIDFIDAKKVNINNEIQYNDKGYIEVGQYNIFIYYKNIELVQIVEVKDTTAPEIIIDEIIKLPYNTNLDDYDFTQYIQITDLSETEDYSIDFSNVNVEIAGEYIAIIEVKDIYENKAQKEFTIIIQENIDDTTTDETEEISTSSQTTTNNSQSNNSSSTAQSSNTTTSNSSQTTTSTTQSSSTTSSSEITANDETTTSNDLSYWCIGGGSTHVAGDGENEHGYYSTWDEAYQAFLNYTSSWSSVQFKISQCACGLYYFWAIQ